MSGHPPFGAQIILNGHEYVACQARRAGIAFRKDGNCFVRWDPAGLARVADALSRQAATGPCTPSCPPCSPWPPPPTASPSARQLVDKPGKGRRYHLPPGAARIIVALLTLRDQVIAPILAGVRSPRMGRKPKVWTTVDRDYENIRIAMQTLFGHLDLGSIVNAA